MKTDEPDYTIKYLSTFRLALYVYEYLLHVGAQKSAQTFLSEVKFLLIYVQSSWYTWKTLPPPPPSVFCCFNMHVFQYNERKGVQLKSSSSFVFAVKWSESFKEPL